MQINASVKKMKTDKPTFPRRIQRKSRKAIKLWQLEITARTTRLFNDLNQILDNYKGGNK